MVLPSRPLSRQLAITAIAVIILLITLVYTAQAVKHQPQLTARQTNTVLPSVSVIEVQNDQHLARLQGYGEAKPRYALELSSELTGKVTDVTDQLKPGHLIQQGDVLAHIDPTDYQQAVALSEQALAQAELTLLLEQREADQAHSERKKSKFSQQPASALALRKPQLAAAQAGLKQAKAALEQARRDLANTQIKSPFNAIVIKRHIAPGQYLEAGDRIATLYSSDRMEVRISLPLSQWQLLPATKQLIGQPIVTLADKHDQQWQGFISSVEQHVDASNRQKSLVVSVDEPLQQQPPLLAGTFLSATINSPVSKKLLGIPASSLTSAGQVWYVAEHNRLANFEANVVFQQPGILFIEAPAAANDRPLQILTAPLPSYIAGQSVRPNISQLAAEIEAVK